MRTDPRSDLLRRVDDGSSRTEKALWHAVTALEDIVGETFVPVVGPGEVAARALRMIDASLSGEDASPEEGC